RRPMKGQHGQRDATALLEYAVEVRTRAYPRGAREPVGRHRGKDGGVSGPPPQVRRLRAETLAALGAATRQDLAAVGGRHAGTEAVVALALEVAGLVGALGGHAGGSAVTAEKTGKSNDMAGGRSTAADAPPYVA